MGAYEDQCAPANPRMPMLADMKDIMTAAYYGTSLGEVRSRRELPAAVAEVAEPAAEAAAPTEGDVVTA